MNIKDITNNNSKNIPGDDIYHKFNEFIFSNDIKLIGKLLHRFQHFLNVKDLPGDIVEIGVFKGSGISTFLKFIEIYCPNSNKKVIGFDIFDVFDGQKILSKDLDHEKKSMNIVYDRVNKDDLSLESVTNNLVSTTISDERYLLVKGDVEETLPKFLENNPGFRISYLYIDVDLDRPTYVALKLLWNRILPGGVILFDEYEYHKFTESNGVEKFLQEMNVDYNIKSTNWIAPTAFMYKKGF